MQILARRSLHPANDAWWDDFHTPMEERIAELRARNVGDAEAHTLLDHLAQEPELHRRHPDCYAYEFFVARRTADGTAPFPLLPRAI